MYFPNENSNFSSPSRKTPYSRPNNQKFDPTISKIITKPRILENNYGRCLVPMKPISLNNSHGNPVIYRNYDEPSTSYQNDNTYYSDGMYGITITSCYAENHPQTVHFRPRKSQLKIENTFDNSKDMIIERKTPEKSKSFKTTADNSPNGFQIKSRYNLMRIFTGTVDNILQWGKLKNSFQILFEVTAVVDFVQQGKWKSEKKFSLRDSNSGFKLQVVYHEIDRPIENLSPDSLVTCIGRLLTRNHFQAYKVEECSEDKRNDLQRLSFICNRVADELVAAGKKKNDYGRQIKLG